MSISDDYGDHFNNAITVSNNTTGRVDTAMYNDTVVVSYLENEGKKVTLKVDQFDYSGKKIALL